MRSQRRRALRRWVFYNRFDGKHGFTRSPTCRGFNELRDRVNSAGPTAHARLRAAADEYRSFALDSPQHYRLMFEHVSEAEPSDQAVEQAYESFRNARQLGAGLPGCRSTSW